MLIEFALVFILFAFICYALVVFGLALNLKSNLTHAASEGARAAVGAGGGCDPLADDGGRCQQAKEDAARDRAVAALSGQTQLVQDNAHVTENIGDCDSTLDPGGAQCMTVTIDYPLRDHPIVPLAPGLGIVVPDTLHTASVVQVSN